MTTSGSVEQEPDSGYPRLERQIAWYDSKSMKAQRFYKLVKITELVCAILIPFMASINADATAALGAVIVLLVSIEQMNQWSQNWTTYRSTCEALRHEKYSYLGKSGVYEGKTDDEARRILTQRVESLISTEHSKWISRQEYENRKG
ncbi:MAG: DUF4231 domain-containing protein [bacterium]|nr:DUF4231 domain-containing protein [bacterium]